MLALSAAAKSHVDRSIEGPGAYGSTSPPNCVYVASNVNGTFNHICTDEVFGPLGPTGRFSETTSYGPWQFPEKPIPLYGDGQNGRDWLYAEDHVDALLLAATQGTSG